MWQFEGVVSNRPTQRCTWLLSHPAVTEWNAISLFMSLTELKMCPSHNLKKKSPPKTTSFKFIVTDLPLLPHVYFLKWFQTNFSLTAPPWVSMATTAWESTAACLRAAHRPSLADVTLLFMFPGWACRQAWPSAHPYRGLHHAAWLAWFSVMWRQARSGGPHRINAL